MSEAAFPPPELPREQQFAAPTGGPVGALPAGGVGETPGVGADQVASGLGVHLRRVFVDGVRTVRPMPAEAEALAAGGITDPLMQGYSAWRRSLLLVAMPIALLSGVLALWDLATNVDTEGLTSLGVLSIVGPSFAVLVLTLGTVIAALSWTRPHTSARVLLIGWAISLSIPLLVAVIPVSWLLDAESMAALGPDAQLTLRFLVGFAYAINLLPTLLSFPSGVVRGGARIKALLPSSTISGWVLIVLAPIYAVFFVIALILVEQLAGNALLMLAILLLVASPFVHVLAARLYTRPLTSEDELRKLDAVQRRAGFVSLGGAALIVIWALTTEFVGTRVVGSGEQALLDHRTALLRAVELIARILITTAVFSHLLLQITEANWRFERGFTDPEALRRHELQMAQVEHTLRVTGDQAG